MKSSIAVATILVVITSLLAIGIVNADITAVAPWYQKTSTSFPRMEVIVCKMDTVVYVMGGYYTSNRDISNVVEKYDLVADSWTTLTVTLPKPIHHSDASVYSANGNCYIAGGFTSGSQPIVPLSDLYSFNGTAFTQLASMPTARGALTVEIIGDNLYAIGGAQVYNQDPVYATLEVYNIPNNTWTTKASMNYEREHLTSGVINGKIYVAAGRAHGNRGLTYHEVYDPATNAWTVLPSVPTGRSGCHAAVVGDKVYVLGGETTRVFDNVEAYSPTTNTWYCYSPMPGPRHGLGAIAYGTRVYSIVGGPTSAASTSNTVYYLETTTATNGTCGWTNYPYTSGSSSSTGGIMGSSSSTALFAIVVATIASLLA